MPTDRATAYERRDEHLADAIDRLQHLEGQADALAQQNRGLVLWARSAVGLASAIGLAVAGTVYQGATRMAAVETGLTAVRDEARQRLDRLDVTNDRRSDDMARIEARLGAIERLGARQEALLTEALRRLRKEME